MRFINETTWPSNWTMGFAKDGRERLVVAMKATYTLPDGDGELTPAAEQQPLIEADISTGEPGLSATLYECDFAHFKQRCDVLLVGSAHAPESRPVTELGVAMGVGAMRKGFWVIGPRVWEQGLLGRHKPSRPQAFTRLPLSYDCAYGGSARHPDDEARVKTFLDNPVGVGFYPFGPKEGMPLACTSEARNPVDDTQANVRPMGFGPLGRHFRERARYAGSYDRHWLETRAPFWPEDFDEAYFQAAPPDQQIAHPLGGETVMLANLTPGGRCSFVLPTERPMVVVTSARGQLSMPRCVLDTVLLEPDDQRISLVYRMTLPLKNDCFDLREVLVCRDDEVRRERLLRPISVMNLPVKRPPGPPCGCGSPVSLTGANGGALKHA